MPTDTRSEIRSVEEGHIYRLLCPECDRPTNHAVRKSVEYESEHRDGNFAIKFWEEHQVVECLGCQTVSFRRRFRDTESLDYDENGDAALIERVELFPPRMLGRSSMEDAWTLPGDVRLIYEESLAALRAGLPVLSGIGLRAIVETVCKERQAGGGNLESRIEGLVAQGVLTREGADILHSLRMMGNSAAHEVRPHPPADLNVAFDVIEHVLTGVYILPRRAARLPQRSGA